MLEALGFSLLLVLAVRVNKMSDRKKIEKIFEYTKVWVVAENGDKKKCVFVKENDLGKNGEVGTVYIYSLPLGLPYKKVEYLNDNIGVFKDGLNKNVELEFKSGLLFVYVYEDDLPEKIEFEEEVILTKKLLESYANKFLVENYGIRLKVPLVLNEELGLTCGRFIHLEGGDEPVPLVIELNKKLVINNEPNIVLDVLKHELVHYALFMLGKPCDDGHPVFENELKRLGIVSQDTINEFDIDLMGGYL